MRRIYLLILGFCSFFTSTDGDCLRIRGLNQRTPRCGGSTHYCCGCDSLFYSESQNRMNFPLWTLSRGECLNEPCLNNFCLVIAQLFHPMKTCASDNDCDSNLHEFCRDEMLCVPLKRAGQKCKEHRECLLHRCFKDECFEDVQPCQHDEECIRGPQFWEFCNEWDYCERKRQNGDPCKLPKECELDTCHPTNICALCLGDEECKPGTTYCDTFDCHDVKPLGVLCKRDEECDIQKCNKRNQCGTCAEDIDCENSYCQNYTCHPLKELGISCLRDEQCKTDKCRDGSGEFICSNCDRDDDCNDDTLYCLKNMCAPKKPNGAECTIPNECLANNCNDIRLCGDCATDTECGPRDFCCDPNSNVDECNNQVYDCTSKLFASDTCLRNRMCDSSFCDNVCGQCNLDGDCSAIEYCEFMDDPNMANTCDKKWRAGSSCKRDPECLEGTCHDRVCSDCQTDDTCSAINADNYCKSFGGYNQCMPKGHFNADCEKVNACLTKFCIGGKCKECRDDKDCKDPNSSSAQYCTGNGNCSSKKPNGDVCGRFGECQSDNCCRSRCRRSAC